MSCSCKIEVSENKNVIGYSNKRLRYCWGDISMRRSDKIQCMIMYVSLDRSMLGEVIG